MAASRIERFQSIVKRCEGLMKGNLLKKKPIWYDVYKKYPPFVEPTIVREKSIEPIREIFYAEDIERANKFNLIQKESITFRKNKFRGSRDKHINLPNVDSSKIDEKLNFDKNLFDLNKD